MRASQLRSTSMPQNPVVHSIPDLEWHSREEHIADVNPANQPIPLPPPFGSPAVVDEGRGAKSLDEVLLEVFLPHPS